MSELFGFYEDMSFEEYAAEDALNGSKIVNMRRSPMNYLHQKYHPAPPSAAMEIGTLVHRLILEPELVGEIAVWGIDPGQKVRNGRVWEEFQAENAGKTILTASDFVTVTSMAKAALKNAPLAKYATASGPTEVSLFWRHPHTKRRYKARLDKIIPETNTIFDLKTTRDCHSYKFGGQAYSLGYHLKMALYFQGYRELTGKEPEIRLGAIDSKAPHESAVYRITRDVILQGIEELDVLVAKITDCEESSDWPPEYDQESDLLLPTWAMNDQYGDGEAA